MFPGVQSREGVVAVLVGPLETGTGFTLTFFHAGKQRANHGRIRVLTNQAPLVILANSHNAPPECTASPPTALVERWVCFLDPFCLKLGDAHTEISLLARPRLALLVS